MIRYIKHISLILAGSILFVSCKKQLDTVPEDRLQELITFDNVRNALIGCYDGFQSGNYYNSPASSGNPCGWSVLPDIMGDDMVETLESLGNWNTMSEMLYASDNATVGGLFIQPYEIISRVNNLLNNISKFEVGDDIEEAKRIKAQVLAIRAMCHFDLMRYFAKSFDRNSTEAGVPYVKVFNALKPFEYLPARNTVKEDYDNILSDLNEALVNFREGGNTTDNGVRYFIDSTVIYAIRARVNYYASQWASVIADANVALDNRPLANSAGYIASFSIAGEATPNSEVYWQIPSDGTLLPGRSVSGSNPTYRVTNNLKDVILGMGGVYINSGINRFNQVSLGGVNRTICWKYPGIRSFKVFRAGEMMLMRAEAKQRSGDITAIDDLNSLRTNRGVANANESGTALLDAILLMRRVELLGEGHRWFDLRRTTRTIVRSECITNGGESRAAKCNVPSTDRGWTFPIPFNELKVNPNLTQNPGY
jgi:starch-binding outer membrane protein, SusD/RagB family